MIYNPITGQYGDYEAPTATAGVGMNVLDAAGVQSPLAFRMLEQSPGIFASMGYSTFRGSNTLLKGGSKQSLFRTAPVADDFVAFGSRARRAQKKIDKLNAGKTPFLRRSLQQNFPRPRNISQFTDLSIFADSRKKLYTPFGASGMLGNTKFGRSLGERMAGFTPNANESAFGPGLFSAITAGVKIDRLEAKAARGNKRAIAKLSQVDQNLNTLRSLGNNPLLDQNAAVRAARVNPRFAGGTMVPAHERLAAARAAGNVGTVFETSMNFSRAGEAGVRGNLMASSMAGAYTQYFAGYARGSLGFGGAHGLVGRALEGAGAAEERFAKSFVKAFGDSGLTTKSGRVIAGTDDAARAFLRTTGGQRFFREIGTKGIAKLATSGGGRMLAMRAGAMAIPGLNVLAAVSFAYDIGQMMGEGVKGAINFAKDAAVSLKGSINKPAFGMGYRDTEAAATSRARGVMAIQNSRLNMRSLLGSEAGMMAAHYG